MREIVKPERKTRRVQLALTPALYREIAVFGLIYGMSVTAVFEKAAVTYMNIERRRSRKVLEGAGRDV